MSRRLIFLLLIIPYFAFAESSVEIGPIYSHLNFDIGAFPTEDNHFKGNLLGVEASYSYKVPSGIFFNLNTLWLENNIYSFSHIKRSIQLSLSGCLFGYNFLASCFTITPYTGIGFCYITQQIAAENLHTTTPTYSIPTGIMTLYKINNDFQMGLNLIWSTQVDATFETSEIVHGRWRLKNRYSYMIQLPLNYQFTFCETIKGFLKLTPYLFTLFKGPGASVSALGLDIYIPSQRYYFLGTALTCGLSF